MPCGQRAALGVAEVLRDHVASLRLSPEQGKAAAHIVACRTGRLGGHAFVCDRCGEKHFAYNSCRDRHCPRCGGLDQAIWAEAQQQHLLPLSYFHLVFTVPASLRPFFLGQGRVHAFEALFAAASETILDVAARQGLLLGVLAVLHTWNQLLDHHPHIHCLVPGGGFGPNGFVVMERFLFSYKRLRYVFKVKLLQKLRILLKQGLLSLGRASAYELLEDADSREWNMKVKRALAGPDAVIKYFARYTKRIGLSDSRVIAYDGKTVTYRYRDRQDGNRAKLEDLGAPRFCQRFLNHVLPPGLRAHPSVRLLEQPSPRAQDRDRSPDTQGRSAFRLDPRNEISCVCAHLRQGSQSVHQVPRRPPHPRREVGPNETPDRSRPRQSPPEGAMTTLIPTRWTAVGAADLTPEVCHGMAAAKPSSSHYTNPGARAPSQRDARQHKRLARASQGSRTAPVGPPLHALRVPMHLIRVPRG